MLSNEKNCTQKNKTSHTLYYLSLDSYFMGEESDGEGILDAQFFVTKQDAIDYAKDYLRNVMDEMMIENTSVHPLEVNHDRIQMATDDMSYTIELHRINADTLEAFDINRDENNLYYISSFSTLYYLEGDEVIEPDEIRMNHVLEHKLYSSYEQALAHMIEVIQNLDKHEKCYILNEEGLVILYGFYNEHIAYEYRLRINQVSNTQFIQMIKQHNIQTDCLDQTICVNEIKEGLNKLSQKYNNKNTYDLLSPCIEQFDLWF